MIRPIDWKEFRRYPVVVSIALLAGGLSVAWWVKADVWSLFESSEIHRGQFWRLFSSAFPHINILHLVFNVYWLWVFGARVEQAFGHVKTAGLLALFAAGSNALDFAFDAGGVGLSGVVYGLFSLLWVLSRRDDRFRDTMDQETVRVFVGWFFLCIATTMAGMFTVANVAHGGGAILGILVGAAITLPRYRWLPAAAVSGILIFGAWGATLGRPFVNLSKTAGFQEGQWGHEALLANRNEEAVRWFSEAAKLQPKIPQFWFNLGIAYHRLGNLPTAKAAYERAHQLEPNNPDYNVPKVD